MVGAPDATLEIGANTITGNDSAALSDGPQQSVRCMFKNLKTFLIIKLH
jgi:hypothetical protein